MHLRISPCARVGFRLGRREASRFTQTRSIRKLTSSELVHRARWFSSDHPRQPRSLFLQGMEDKTGTSPVVLGLLGSAERHLGSIGYLRPIAAPASNQEDEKQAAEDTHTALVAATFKLGHQKARTVFSNQEALRLLTTGKTEELLDAIVHEYSELLANCDFVLVEGMTDPRHPDVFGRALNEKICKVLGIPMLLVLDAHGGSEHQTSADDIVNSCHTAFKNKDERIDLAGIIVNKYGTTDDEARDLQKRLLNEGIKSLGVMPLDQALGAIRMAEVKAALKAEVVFGEEYLSNQLDPNSMTVGSVMLPTLLDILKNQNQTIVITYADRLDIVLGVIASRLSRRLPNVSGIVLTGEDRDLTQIKEILQDLQKESMFLPVLHSPHDTFHTVRLLSDMREDILPESSLKIERCLDLFDRFVSEDTIVGYFGESSSMKMTPKMFQHQILQLARRTRKRIVLPEGTELRMLLAAEQVLAKKIADLTILGPEESIRSLAESHALLNVLEKAEIIDPTKFAKMDDYVEKFYEMRKKKGVNRDMARDALLDGAYLSTMMVELGDADGMVAGCTYTTANTVRPALQLIKTAPDRPVVSSIFFMCLPDKVLVYGDCAINTNPTAEELSQIAVTSAETAEAFGISPHVALLSYATGDSNTGPLIEKVSKAKEAAKTMRPDLPIYGPIQYDAATNVSVAASKVRGEADIKGDANVLIFPDLNTGNNTYKAVQQSTNCIAIGPVLQGLRKPVNDLSRGATVPDIVNTIAMTVVQAQAISDKK